MTQLPAIPSACPMAAQGLGRAQPSGVKRASVERGGLVFQVCVCDGCYDWSFPRPHYTDSLPVRAPFRPAQLKRDF